MEEARKEDRVKVAQKNHRDKVTTEKPERSGRQTNPVNLSNLSVFSNNLRI